MPNTIDSDLVRHIGVLSRIELSDEQVGVLSGQLGSILGYFDKLQELDTEDVEPLAHAAEVFNVFADDTPGPSLDAERALANAPADDGEFFIVPKVIRDGSS